VNWRDPSIPPRLTPVAGSHSPNGTGNGLRILYVSHSFPLPGQPLSNVGGMQRVATGLHAALAERADLRLSSLVLETSWKATPYRMPGFMTGLLRAIPRVVEE